MIWRNLTTVVVDLRIAAEQGSFDAAASMRTYHDQIGAPATRLVDHLVANPSCMAFQQLCLAGQSRLGHHAVRVFKQAQAVAPRSGHQFGRVGCHSLEAGRKCQDVERVDNAHFAAGEPCYFDGLEQAAALRIGAEKRPRREAKTMMTKSNRRGSGPS